MPLNTGTIIHNNRYSIARLLGQGGMGAVYRAYDLNLKVSCAVKENLDISPEAQSQFVHEAQILAGLRHPNLPRVTDYFFLPGQGQYLVMDFVDGEDLQSMLDRVRAPLPEAQVMPWILQICDALAYLHSQNPPVIHRDVKPANIRITSYGQAMLVDFGIAKLFNPSTKTTMGARAVTPGYSPIEQYGQGKTDVRTDVYALGATLYTLLTGCQPVESVLRLAGNDLLAPRTLNPAVTFGTEQAVLRAMELPVNGRFQGMADFKAALTGAASSPPAYAARQAPPPAQPQAFPYSAPPPARQQAAAHPQPARPRADIDWVTIPAGRFFFGPKNAQRHLPEFHIARFPVTNRQYQAFLKANPQHKGPPGWRGRLCPPGKEDHPVVNVNKRDADTFCQWLGGRLPTEEEWEKAARGTDGRNYPWGDPWKDGIYCNSKEAGIGDTTPVDCYPSGCSPYGLFDMAGNVWEWTCSAYDSNNFILRGGSYGSTKDEVTVFKCSWDSSDFLFSTNGFRCVR